MQPIIRYLFILVAYICMTLAGCGGGQSTLITGPSGSAAATVTPAHFTFSSQVLNSTSASGTVTLTNGGDASLSISKVTVNGDFAETSDCGATLGPGTSCVAHVTFTPTATGSRTGTLSFFDSSGQSPHAVPLSGTGVSAGVLVGTPSSIAFDNVTVGQTSSRTLTITNAGGQNVIVTSAGTSGAGIGLSGISTPFALAPNQNSAFNVTFDPSSSGTAEGSVYLTNDGTTSTLAIPITGTAVSAPIHQVVLQWAPTSSPVLGYNAYRATVSGGPYTKLTNPATTQAIYTDLNVQAGGSYFYIVTAVGTDLAESVPSNEAKTTVPVP
jgi:hypothetical protein